MPRCFNFFSKIYVLKSSRIRHFLGNLIRRVRENTMNITRWLNHNFRIEKIIFLLFIVLFTGAVCIHDPWFDEMQAWLIAKTASWYDLFFVLPHYEGHPPFFHLLLALPARLGVPWEVGLRFFCAGSTLISVYLILFKAPFARWVRLCLPFTFFIFYQYGVLARPYNLMILFTICAAICFPKRMDKPFLFIGCLALLSACHLFGIAIAGGIAGVWLWELRGTFLQAAWYKDKRLLGLAGLWVFAMVLLVSIIPPQDSLILRHIPDKGLSLLPSVLFFYPGDVFLTDIHASFHAMQNSLWAIWGTWILQGILWWILFAFLPGGKRPYVVLPGLFLIGIMCYYMARHHIGMFGIVFLFVFWIAYAEQATPVKHSSVMKKIGKGVLLVSLLMSVFWTVGSLYNDTKYSSFPGKEITSFLQAHQLTDLRILSAWDPSVDINRNNFGTELAFYLGRNVVFNYNTGTNILYHRFEYTPPEQEEEIFSQWRVGGLPDVVLGNADLDLIYGGKNLLRENYAVVYQIKIHLLWKINVSGDFTDNIYVRKDLLKAHHLKPIDGVPVFHAVS